MTLAAKAPEERRRRILNAAVEVLRTRGFSATRVADIAAAAGTSPALVLYHFTSLDDVFVAALSAVEEQFYADLDAQADLSDPQDRLVRMALLAAEGGSAFGDWQLWLEVWVRATHDQRVDEVRRSSDQRWRKELQEVVHAGVEMGVFSSEEPEDSAIRLASLMDGLAVQIVLGQPDFTPANMVTLWLDGAALELGINASELRARAQAKAHA